MADPTHNQKAVERTLERCRKAGVETYCVCAGSRNSPLVVALSRASGIELFSFFEERAAAFFAVGRIQATDRPVAVVTTSGTAVAELLPAVVEAHYQGLPLIMITADRPAKFRGSGAPQAIEQSEIFGVYAESNPESWKGDRPLHLNVELSEPLSPGEVEELDLTPGVFNSTPSKSLEVVDLTRFLSPDTAVLLGKLKPGQTSGVLDFLESTGLPVLAEANSNLRGHPSLVGQEIRGNLALGEAGRILRLGGVPSCRLWRDLESHPEVPVCSVSDVPFSGLARDSEFIHACPSKIRGHLAAGAIAITGVDPAALLREFDRSEATIFRKLSAVVPGGSLLFLGNSMPIRNWDLAATRDAPEIHVITNRGANGIDGNLSTFLGASMEVDEAWCIVGDLTALYDLAAPWILSQLPSETKRRIVVINNGGGAIFRQVKDLQTLPVEEMDLMTNPHNVRLEFWAAMWGMGYASWDGQGDVPTWGEGGTQVLEVFPDVDETERFWGAYRVLVAQRS